MKFASVNQATRFLEKAKKKQKEIPVLQNGELLQAPPNIYTRDQNKMFLNRCSAVAEIKPHVENGVKKTAVNVFSNPSSCRGFAMESIIKRSGQKFTLGSKIDTPNNITCVFLTSSHKERLNACLQLLNNVEYQAGWPLSKITHLRSNAYALISSKRWSACLPLYSALMLFFKAGSSAAPDPASIGRHIDEFEVPEQFLAVVEKTTRRRNHYAGTGVNIMDALLDCLEDGLLVRFMRHYRCIVGKNPYQHLGAPTANYSLVHSTGIGDFLKLLKYGNKAKSKPYLPIQPKSRVSTVFVHGDMVARAKRKLLSKTDQSTV